MTARTVLERQCDAHLQSINYHWCIGLSSISHHNLSIITDVLGCPLSIILVSEQSKHQPIYDHYKNNLSIFQRRKHTCGKSTTSDWAWYRSISADIGLKKVESDIISDFFYIPTFDSWKPNIWEGVCLWKNFCSWPWPCPFLCVPGKVCRAILSVRVHVKSKSNATVQSGDVDGCSDLWQVWRRGERGHSCSSFIFLSTTLPYHSTPSCGGRGE